MLLACSESRWNGDKERCRWCDGALTGRQLRWCSDECVREYGRDHWWTAAAPAAKLRDGHRCVRGDKAKGCQAHHKTPLHKFIHPYAGRRVRHSDSGCWHHRSGLETLCTDCHHDEHHPAASDGAR